MSRRNNKFFVDRSGKAKGISYGSNAVLTSADSKFGGSALRIDGSNSASVSIPYSEDFNFGANDFTIEFWIKFVGWNDGRSVMTKGWPAQQGSFLFYTGSSNKFAFYSSSNGSTWDIASDQSIISSTSLDTWYHVAVSRSGSTFRAFSNGIITSTWTNSSALFNNTSHGIIIGNSTAGSHPSNCIIDDIRITKGSARYTDVFTPPNKTYPSYANVNRNLTPVTPTPTSSVTPTPTITPTPTTTPGRTLGDLVTFSTPDNGTEVDIIIPGILEITRGNQQGIFNSVIEGSFNSGSSPANTVWSKGEGWNNLCSLSGRTYRTWRNELWTDIGMDSAWPANVGKEFIMKHTPTNRYWLVKFTQWTQGGGGGFTYSRQEFINCNSIAPSVAPTNIVVEPANGGVFLSWTAPPTVDIPAITDCVVQYSTDGGTTFSNFTHSANSAPNIRVTGLDTANSYVFRVASVNSVGTSPFSNWTTSPVSPVATQTSAITTFTSANYGSEVDVILAGSLEITRNNNAGIYNSAKEGSYDQMNYISPLDTVWNGDGWANLCNLDTRSYNTWRTVAQSFGGPPSSVDQEMIMKHVPSGRYWLIKFTSWTSQGNGGGFSYERQAFLGC